MGKHRRGTRHRRAAIAAVAVAAVGVPSAAMACAHWPDGGQDRLTGAAVEQSGWRTSWKPGDGIGLSPDGGEPTTAAPGTPGPASPSAHTPATRLPAGAGAPASPRTHSPAHAAWTAAPAKSGAGKASGTPSATAAGAGTTTVSPVATQATGSPAPAVTASSTPAGGATASGTTARIVALVNAERAKAGCSALTLDPALTKAAQEHSADMAAHQNMSHTGSDGSAPSDRISAAGYDWSAYGENVAYGYATPEEVMAGWMASPGHRANILDCSFKEIGVGLAQPGSYWTQDFGTPR
ncbi:CAP domain-containing protein [Streptomyces sp. NPDC047017]|uniref:CAP domain-containing protein n=1 Tax=Streptomyces sp. NPDC047017 TaxID=3155024 RepID=UPI00340FE3B6